MGNWRLRTKLLVVLLIPSLAALALGALRVSVDYSEVQSLTRNSEQVKLEASVAAVAHELQAERDYTSVYLASSGTGDRSGMDKQRTAVDQALEQLRNRVDYVSQGSYPGVAENFDAAATGLNRLQGLRSVVDEGNYPFSAAFRAYSDAIEDLLNLGEQGITRIDDPGLVRISLATNAVARAEDEQSSKRALLGAALARGSFQTSGFESGGVRELLAADAELEAALNDFRKWATPAQSQAYDDTVAGTQVDTARTIESTATYLAEEEQDLTSLNGEEWFATSTKAVDLTEQVGTQLRDELSSRVDAQANTARTEMFVAGGLVLGALVLAFAIALLVARSLLLPLRTLRRSALNVAEHRLPDTVKTILQDPNPNVAEHSRVQPIPVHTKEEIGRVARSFDAVQSQALRLASEQALLRNNVNDLFVNLARRSQTLVQRQLSLIDRLEQDEQDPDQLGSLFELDHLATRMRRNNENLLILGGTDLTRRMMRPVPLSEVVGAAVSEVEQYARIVVAEAPDLAIQGRVVNDFVHLVAELLENATVFSNPDTEVAVRTAYRRQELVLEIRDRGVGIDDSEIVEINERLTKPPEVDVAVSRRMGLYVVGQLARRHGIRVHLQNNGDLEGGVTANVHLAGDFVAQVTPDGQHMPMPDVQRPGEDQRDQLTESGTHLGLAAAFGRGGVAERGLPEPLPERTPSEPLPQRTPSEPLPQRIPSAQVEESTAFLPQPSPEQESSATPDYSVQYSTESSFAASDIPRWDGSTQAWPQEDDSGDEADAAPVAADQGGQCGLPSEMEGTADLFRSPFEAEKATAFTPPSTDNGWPNGTRDSSDDESPAQGMGSVFGSSKRPPREADDTPTERLPIYEAVLSQWFREEDDSSAESTPAESSPTGSAFAGATPEAPGLEGPAPAESVSDSSARQDEVDPLTGSAFTVPPIDSTRSGNGLAEHGFAESSFAETHVEPETSNDPDSLVESDGPAGAAEPDPGPVAAPLPTPKAPDPGWGSADVGWQAAEALVEQTKQVQETTSAGLPKRVPKSNLVPGSAAPKPQPSAPSQPATPRSPDAVRGRMSNFQQGIRRGRHAKAEPVSTEQPNSNSSRHEEQE